jgi:hypothetical protein
LLVEVTIRGEEVRAKGGTDPPVGTDGAHLKGVISHESFCGLGEAPGTRQKQDYKEMHGHHFFHGGSFHF